MLVLKDIIGYLHYYAYRYENDRFEHWELINEAWMVVHRLNRIQFASQGIRWAMMSYKARENQYRRYGSSTATILPLETDAGINKLVREMIARPVELRYRVDDADTISWLADNACLSLDERMMLDQRYWKHMGLKDIADTRGVTHQAINQRLGIITHKLCLSAQRLERRTNCIC